VPTSSLSPAPGKPCFCLCIAVPMTAVAGLALAVVLAPRAAQLAQDTTHQGVRVRPQILSPYQICLCILLKETSADSPSWAPPADVASRITQYLMSKITVRPRLSSSSAQWHAAVACFSVHGRLRQRRHLRLGPAPVAHEPPPPFSACAAPVRCASRACVFQ
jgi:hypothetical protein